MPQQCVPGCAAAEARDQPGSCRRSRSMGELRFELGQCSVAVPGHETRQGGTTARSRIQQRRGALVRRNETPSRFSTFGTPESIRVTPGTGIGVPSGRASSLAIPARIGMTADRAGSRGS